MLNKNFRPVTLDDYKSVTKSLYRELCQPSPNETVLLSCKRFLAEAPLPLPDLKNIKPEQCWGHS